MGGDDLTNKRLCPWNIYPFLGGGVNGYMPGGVFGFAEAASLPQTVIPGMNRVRSRSSEGANLLFLHYQRLLALKAAVLPCIGMLTIPSRETLNGGQGCF